jgi:predicted ATP-grasp superfamily ATP-dependent carboligase
LVHEWVTGGGLAGEALPESWAAEGRAMRLAIAGDFASLGADAVRVVMTVDERFGKETRSPNIDVEPIGSEGKLERVIDLSRQADFTVLVAPEPGGTLATLTRAIEAAGGRTLGSSAVAVDATASKLRCGRRLAELGVRTPEAWVIEPGAGVPTGLEYPLVVKPDDGAGCADTFLVKDAERWPELGSIRDGAIAQRYVAGAAMSATFLADGLGRAWLIGVGAQEVSVEGGRFVYRGGRLPVGGPIVEESIRRAVETQAGLRGFVGVDFIKDDYSGQVTVLEINPRPTTSYVGLCRLLPAGVLARVWLSVSAGIGDLAENHLDELASRVHAGKSLRFDANGAVRFAGGGGVAP